jgi:hypothetical protein
MKNRFARRNPWIFATALLILAVLFVPLALMAITADAGAGGNGTSSLAMAGLMGAPFMLRDKAGEHEGGGGGAAPDVATALAEIQDTTLPMSQRLGVAIKALGGIDPTNQLAKIKADLTDVQGQLTARDSELATVRAELETANKRIAALTTDVTEAQTATAAAETRAKELQTKEQDLQKRVDAKVKEELAAKGFPAAKLPNSSEHIGAEVPSSRAELEDKLKECKTQGERSAMLRAFKAGLN